MSKAVAWTDSAKADLRAIDRTTALGILRILARQARATSSAFRMSSLQSCGSEWETTASVFTTLDTQSASSPSNTAAKPIAEAVTLVENICTAASRACIQPILGPFKLLQYFCGGLFNFSAMHSTSTTGEKSCPP